MEKIFRKANENDKEEVFALYRSLVGTYGCAWTADYPGESDVAADIKQRALYVLCSESGEIMGAASLVTSEEINHLECWDKSIQKPCELVRIGIKEKYHNQGLAKELLYYMEEDAPKRGFDGMQFLVSKTNPKALALYDGMKFKRVGETYMYEIDWFCYERKF